jgi:hypothetical protein
MKPHHWHRTSTNARFVGIGWQAPDLWVVSFWWFAFSLKPIHGDTHGQKED